MSMDTGGTDEIDDEEKQELIEEVERRRTLTGVAVVLVSLIAVTFSAFQMWIAARGRTFGVGEFQIVALQQLQVNSIHVSFGLVLAFLLFPASRGDGFVARRLRRVEPLVRRHFGDDHPLARGTGGVSRFVGWAFLDPDMNRIAPVDVVMAILAVMPAYYMTTQYDEIREISVHRFEDSQAIHEVFPLLDVPVAALAAIGVPIDEASAAFLLGVLGMLLVLEATRRALGLLLATLVGLFIVYARWGYLVPRDSVIGALSIQPDTWGNIIYNLWYTVEAGVHSQPISVSVRFIYIFILVGAFLEMSGAGRWFIDLAYSATGTRKGGPAKASVVSSGFMGMLSGSSIANTVTTGAFTIPLMKRSGYSPEFSGAVESSSSSGGQMLPPVMGAAAFLIVELAGIPYADVIIAATLPAIAFFFGMWVMVHFEAVRGGIGGLPRAELPGVRSALRTGWFYLIPIVLLLYFLVIARFSINRAGWLTIVAVVALLALVAAYDERTRIPLFATIAALFLVQLWAYATVGGGAAGALAQSAPAGDPLSLGDAAMAAVSDLGTITILVSAAFVLVRPRVDPPLLNFDEEVDESASHIAETIGKPELSGNRAYRFGTFVLKSMDSGARTATTVVVAVAAAGVVPGVISVSGLGPNLAALISQISGESMLVLLTLTGVAAIIFGMGMPTTAMYIILVAMLEAPLVEAGVLLIAAHLFILYWGLMADVTPPVAVAAFAGAGVAKAEEMKTAMIAFVLSLNKVLVPFAFVFSPGILLVRVESLDDWWIIGWNDVLDVGFFVPDVIIPVVGMFLGVYALGVTIIGHQYTSVDNARRGLYSIASIFLMVPEIPLLIVEAGLTLLGVPSYLLLFEITVSLRIVGLGLLLGLSYRNRSRAETDSVEPSMAATGDA